MAIVVDAAKIQWLRITVTLRYVTLACRISKTALDSLRCLRSSTKIENPGSKSGLLIFATVVSLFGLLPLIPVCSVVGIGAGVVGLVRIGFRRAPAEGVWFALIGIAGGTAWLVLVLFIVGDLGEWLQSIGREFFNMLNPSSKGLTHI